jgi:HlyD family secretion protein
MTATFRNARPARRRLHSAAGAAAMLAIALLLAACNTNGGDLQGWVEANLIFVSPDESGRVETLGVREGARVEAGAPLFTLDDELQRADVAVAQATLTNARQAFERAQALLKKFAGTEKAYEEAEAAMRTAEARLNSAQTRLARRSVKSPVSGTVQQVYFRPGEQVPASRPVLALLPPGNVKVRFFVPETMLSKVAYGDAVTVRCDGCAGDLGARVSFIARSAEFTPPVIYSQEERAKLVFLVEALPERPENLRVGQPVSVVLMSKEAPK